MPDELHAELKAALAYDRSSFAEDYLSKREKKKSKTKNGGTKNG